MIKFFTLACFFIFELSSNLFAQQEDTASFKVIEFSLCKDVVEREPIDVVSSFTMEDSKAWVFARIVNTEGIQTIFFKWFFNDELIAELNTKIGTSNNWRTYASVNLKPGFWRVELADSNHNAFKEIRFNVSE